MSNPEMLSVYKNLKVGKDNAISRTALAELVNMSDRKLRKTIADIRENGGSLGLTYYVVSDSHGKGYWLTRDEHEIEVFVRQMMSRVKNIMPSVRNAQFFISSDKQASLFDGLSA